MKKIIIPLLFIIGFLNTTAFTQDYQTEKIVGSEEDVCMNPIFSPDGSMLAFTKSGYAGIWIYDLRNNSVKQLTDEPASGFAFKWSSDSKSILTRVARFENNKRLNAVKIFDVTTNESRQLTEYKSMMPYLPQWIDGDEKVYLPTKGQDEIFNTGKSRNNNTNVVVFEKNNMLVFKNLITNSEKTLTPIKDARYINLSTSPDGNKVVFEVVGGNLYTINTDGSGLTDLGKGYRARWASNSSQLIYMISEDDGHSIVSSDIYIINADGTGKRNLTNTLELIEMDPSISPDGKTMAYDLLNDGSIYLMTIE